MNLDLVSHIEDACADFQAAIRDVPDARYLMPINGGWSPRDMAAHLVGWNRGMIAACQSLRRGETPAYYADHDFNYSHINAEYMALYDTQDKDTMLSEMVAGLGELTAYLRGLDPREWEADFGVKHYSGDPATIARIIRSLAEDYAEHTQEIRTLIAS